MCRQRSEKMSCSGDGVGAGLGAVGSGPMSLSLRSHLLLWMVCFTIFMTSCSTFSLHPEVDFASTPNAGLQSAGDVRVGHQNGVPMGNRDAEPSQSNNSSHEADQSEVEEENIHITMKPVDIVNSFDSTAGINDSKSPGDQFREYAGTRKAKKRQSVPELRMSDRERQKRAEMDRSSDQLIVTLSAEQSDEEHLNLMKYLRELQKQEIIIEV